MTEASVAASDEMVALKRSATMKLPPWLRKGAARAELVLKRLPVLAAAYIYGSALKTPAHRDVDVALLLRPSRRRPADSRLAAIALDLDKAFGTETDLRLLDQLPDPVRHRVIRDGVRLVTPDPLCAIRFESETFIRYLDFKPVFDRLNDCILRRASRG